MTQNPPEAPADHPSDAGAAGPDTGPRVTRDEVRDLGRLRLSRDDRKIAGVAGGLARHLDIDPIILRVAFVVLIFFGGAGLLLYAAFWLLVPEEGTEEAKLRLDERSRGVALVLVGALAALAVIGDSAGDWGFPWPLAIVGGVIVLIVLAVRGDSHRQPAPPAPPAAAPSPGAPATGPAYPTFVPPPPPNPRKRGPILFWFTMALSALAVGVLGIVDVAGADVTDSAYPALVLGIIGVMLVVGAFYGRAGGLIAVGLLTALVTAGATAAREVDAGHIDERPLLASKVDDTYDLWAGQVELDLTAVQDLRNLNGRTIDVDTTFGRIVVTVPDRLNVVVDADVDAGETRLFGDDEDHSNTARFDSPVPGAPTVHINADVTFGEIVVEVERSLR